LEIVDDLPMTASKKIQKFRLRKMIGRTLEAEAAAGGRGTRDDTGRANRGGSNNDEG
jgi:hypothetical protein